MAKQQLSNITIYTDGSYHQHLSALGSAWIRTTSDGERKEQGYCIQSPHNNKGGSLLGELIAVSEALRELTNDMGRCAVTIHTDCKIICDTAEKNEWAHRIEKSKQDSLMEAWAELEQQVHKHDVTFDFEFDQCDPKLLEAHYLAQDSALYLLEQEAQADQMMRDHVQSLDLCAA